MSRRKEPTLFRARPRLASLSLSISFAGALAALMSCGGDEPPQGSGGSGGGMGGSGGGLTCFPGDTKPCYTGPVVTENVGACRSGERTCNPEGSGFGVCVGQVTPTVDDCATPADEDCDGVPAPACPGTVLFGQRFGGAGDDEGRGVAFDEGGNLIATGSFEGSIDFGGGEVKSAGGKDVFVVKLGPAGEPVFSKAFGDKDADQVGTSAAVGKDGSAVITGHFAGSIDFGGGPVVSAGGRDVFVLKLTPEGNVAWAKTFGGAGALQEGLAVDVDDAGDVLVAGAFDGTLDAGGVPLVSLGGQDGFVLKLEAAMGGVVWSKAFGGPGKQVARALAVDAAGTALVGGGFDGSIDLGNGPMLSAGGEDAFFVKLGSGDGTPAMGSQFGDASNQAITGIALPGGGGYVLAGRFEGAIGFETTMLQGAGAEDIFVASYGAPGELIFAKAFGDKGSQVPEGVAVDAAGAIVIAGRFTGSLDLGHKPPLPGTEAYDIFIGKLDAAGAYVYGYAYGGNFDQVALGVAVDSKGNAAVTGSYFGSLKFGADPLVSAGLRDLFLAKLAP